MTTRTAQAGHRLLTILTTLALVLPAAAFAASLTRTSAFTYDPASGLLVKEIIEPDNSSLCLVTSYVYDAYGNKTSATTRNCNGTAPEAAAPTGDPVIAARSSSNTYDARGQFPTTSTNALSQSETKTYDPRFGTVLSLTGPNGLTTNWAYDGFGRKILETRADGNKTKWDYLYCNGINGGTAACPTIGGAAGAWLVQETPLASDGTTQTGPLSKTYYDSLNRPLRTETQGFDGSGASTAIYQDTQYDSLGRPYKKSRPYYNGQTAYWITVAFDALSRVISETQADGTVSSTSYNGLTFTVTNAKSQTRTTTKNSQGQTVSVLDTNSKTLTFSYDPFGNMTKSVDALGNVIALTYDLRGRKTRMVDPDMGTWSYAYNALGQLIRQTDAKAQVSTLAYDKLGRLTNRSEADLISNWYYDTKKGGAACAKGIGKLCQSETTGGYNRVASYDSLGRANQTVTTLDTNYTESISFDARGRLATSTYPGGVVVKYVYTSLGYLKEVRNNVTNALYWQANGYDATGHLLQQTYGNGVVTTQSYNPSNGHLNTILAGAGNAVQNQTYQYDVLGNISSRQDANQNLIESFGYDALNRLSSSTVNGTPGTITKIYSYDVLGNINSRSDVGAYTYNASGANSVRPHAVNRVNFTAGGYRTYAYDANGNLTAETQYNASNQVVTAKSRAEYYMSYNMPQAIANAGFAEAFVYGPEHQRVRKVSTVDGTTYYLNPGNNGALFYEKETALNNTVEQRNYISAGGQVVAVVKQTTPAGGATTTTVRYFHRDNLGSTSVVTNEAGAVVERLAYEPFGKRRYPSGLDDGTNTIRPVTTDRGFTNHEHLDTLGLIHMNARVYDPAIGRFMSPDPYIQDPYDLQSYNRYAYVRNNPLLYIDPSGYFNLGKELRNLGHSISQAWKGVWHSEVGRVVVTVAVAYFTGYYISNSAWATCTATGAQWGSVAAAAGGGFAGGLVGSGGDFKAGLQGAFTAALFYGVGDIAPNGLGNAVGHAAVGCASASMSGGDCGSGALSGAFGSIASQNMPSAFNENFALQLTYVTVVGGTASALGGGKFANGAKTAAFGYLFNFLAHRRPILNPNGIGEDTAYAIEFEKSIPSKEIGWLRRALGVVLGEKGPSVPLRVLANGQDWTQDGICAVQTCYGSRDLPDQIRSRALEIEPQVQRLAVSIAGDNGWNLQYLSRSQLQTIVDGWQSIPDFKMIYGTTDQIIQRFK